MERQHASTGTEWEAQNSYSRAIRTGNTVYIAGTTAVDTKGNAVAEGDPYAQTKHILDIIADALSDVGASLEDVVRTRMYITDLAHQDAVGRAHGEVFSDIRPAATMLQIEGLVEPELLVEIEAEAKVDETDGS
jgi:Putative translation initiation inhibitor, yjgF family